MEQLLPSSTEEPHFLLQSDLPGELIRSFPVETMIDEWPWQVDVLTHLNRYWAARRTAAWNRALRSLNDARCFAIAGEKWELESWLNDRIVEAIAKREARRR